MKRVCRAGAEVLKGEKGQVGRRAGFQAAGMCQDKDALA